MLKTKHNILRFLESGEFSDLELETATGEVYRVHRIILAKSSEFFAKSLSSNFKESHENRIKLNFADPKNVFPSILRFMYGETIKITNENVTALLAMADHYLISSLRMRTADFIKKNITKETVLDLAQHAILFGCGEQIVTVCVGVIAKYFSQLHGVNFSFLPLDVFRRILQHQYLAVKSEFSLYETICRYIDTTKEKIDLTEADVESLFQCTRFVWMEYEQLVEVSANPRVPLRLMNEALLHRISLKERPSHQDPNELPVRLRKRPVYGMRFDYQYDFDQNGVVYWVATKGKGFDTHWENPHMTCEIRVMASGVEKGDRGDLVGRKSKELWTKDVPSSWFSIDLGPNRKVIPSHYTLQHGGSYKSDCLRNWDFQGSEDGNSWQPIRRHTMDQSLNGSFATHSWPLDCSNQYRFFRVLQTGHNVSNNNFLALCGIEIYGELYER